MTMVMAMANKSPEIHEADISTNTSSVVIKASIVSCKQPYHQNYFPHLHILRYPHLHCNHYQVHADVELFWYIMAEPQTYLKRGTMDLLLSGLIFLPPGVIG